MTQTFGEFLTDYCDHNGREIETMHSRDIKTMSQAAAEAVRKAGLVIFRDENTETFTVNKYADEARDVIYGVLDAYFDNPTGFRYANHQGKRFLFDVDLPDVEPFEAALKFVGIPIDRNAGISGDKIAQYLLPRDNPYTLIKLGRAFYIQALRARKGLKFKHLTKK